MRLRLVARTAALVACVSGLAACAQSSGDESPVTARDEPTGTAEGTGRDLDTGTRPVITPSEPWDTYPFGGVGGELTLSNGCLLLDNEVVFWPYDSDWDASSRTVTFAGAFAGNRPAQVGNMFEGGGGGFSAETTDFVSLLGAEAGNAIEDCLAATGLIGVVLAYPTA